MEAMTRLQRRKAIREAERRISAQTAPEKGIRCVVCGKSARGYIQPDGEERTARCAAHLARRMFMGG